MNHYLRNTLFFSTFLLSGQAFAGLQGDYFACQGTTNCALLRNEVPGTRAVLDTGESYRAQYTVNYTFLCSPGRYKSNILVSAGDNRPDEVKYFLQFAGHTDESYPKAYRSEMVVRPVVEGSGPLTLTDVNPGDTSHTNFKAGCNLLLDVTMAVSKGQLAEWLAEVPGIVREIDIESANADLILDVENYYKAKIAAPDATSGFLKKEIEKLTAPGASENDIKRAEAMQRVVDGNSFEAVMAPLYQSLDDLKVLKGKAEALQKKLEFAEAGQGAVFNESIKKAAQAIEKDNR